MADIPGTPTRSSAVDRSGVPAQFRSRSPLHTPAQDPNFVLDRLIQDQVPLAEEYAYEQTFTGVDYHITAVVPFDDRFDVKANSEYRQLLEALAAHDLGAPPPGQSVSVAELQQRAETRQSLLAGIQRASRGVSTERKKPFFKTFGEIQTLSITSRRSAEPVRRLSEASPAEYTKGPRTFAGTMIFTLLQEDVLLDLYRVAADDKYDTEPFFVSDRLPAFNLLIQGGNEAGHLIEGALFGVELIASGLTLSIDDLYTEQHYTYVARWMLPLAKRSRTNDALHELGRGTSPQGRGAISDMEPGAEDAPYPIGSRRSTIV